MSFWTPNDVLKCLGWDSSVCSNIFTVKTKLREAPPLLKKPSLLWLVRSSGLIKQHAKVWMISGEFWKRVIHFKQNAIHCQVQYESRIVCFLGISNSKTLLEVVDIWYKNQNSYSNITFHFMGTLTLKVHLSVYKMHFVRSGVYL